MQDSFLNVPSSGALNSKQAVDEAAARWNIATSYKKLWPGEYEGDCAGISWQGSHGHHYYVRFGESLDVEDDAGNPRNQSFFA